MNQRTTSFCYHWPECAALLTHPIIFVRFQIIQMNPMLSQMSQSNPMVASMLSNPEMMRASMQMVLGGMGGAQPPAAASSNSAYESVVFARVFLVNIALSQTALSRQFFAHTTTRRVPRSVPPPATLRLRLMRSMALQRLCHSRRRRRLTWARSCERYRGCVVSVCICVP